MPDTPSFNTVDAKQTYIDKVNAAAQEASARQWYNANHDKGVGELIELLYRYTGQGSLVNQTELFFSRFDRYGINTLPGNVEHAGLTFFTRPKLPLTRGNLHQVPSLIGLDVDDPNTFAYAIRCWLDTKFCKSGVNMNNAKKCPFFNYESAFNIPLSNACIAQSGWPDPFIQTYTTVGGFFQEDQTFPIGSDRLRKTYDLNFTFKETQGGPILAMLYAWYEVMASLTEGSMVAYAEDIDAQRMCYTVSIYRFLLDPSKRHITHYAKATGCFPKAPPMGALFNRSVGETSVEAAKEISIPFVANKVEYDDPRILLDFNLLVTRYCPKIHTYPILRPETYNNFKGFPFVISTQYGLEMAFREPLDQAYEDETNGKMLATTRERFELKDKFFNGLKPDQLKGIPQGSESRFLYRVAHDPKSAEIKYYLDRQDDYELGGNAKSTENVEGGKAYLPENLNDLPNVRPGTTGYNPQMQQGEDLVDINFDTEVDGYRQGGSGSKSDPIIHAFDPIFVNASGKSGGTIDRAAVERALKSFNGFNRDDVDAGGGVNIRMRDITKEQIQLAREAREANKASNPPIEAEALGALAKNMAKEPEKSPADKAREEKLNNTLLGRMRSTVSDAISRKK